MEMMKLYNGVEIPANGFGVYQVSKEDCKESVLTALKTGYRHIDTAQSYFNEEEVGAALKESDVPRNEIFLTTKVWIDNYGEGKAYDSVIESLKKLQTDYLDLILLHQPVGDYYGAYRDLEKLYEEGKVRAIGVSNFYPDRLVDLCLSTKIKPMVNQIEVNVFNQQIEAKNGPINMEWFLKPGHRLPKEETICSKMKCCSLSVKNITKVQHKSSLDGCIKEALCLWQNLYTKKESKKTSISILLNSMMRI